MLTRNRFFTFTLCALAIPASACIITVDDDSLGGAGGSGSSTSTTATTSTTNTTTTDASSTTDGSSSSSGVAVCDDPAAAGTGTPQTACDSMANFPSTCPDNNEAPVAIGACNSAFSVFSPLGWERFQACLANIPAVLADTCDEPGATNNVQACVDAMYDASCANPAADKVCDDTNDACMTGGENDFETAQCKADLQAFGTAASGQGSGLASYAECINNNLNTPCNELHDICMGAVLGG